MLIIRCILVFILYYGEVFMIAKLLRRNLSLFTFIVIYFIFVITLAFLESFQWETQWYVLTTLIPFFLLGAIFDYIVDKNHDLSIGYKIISQLMPSGIFLLYVISIILEEIDRPPIEAFNYMIWIFLAVPLFIISHFKEDYRKRMFSSLLGTGFVGAIYLHLTTLTDELDEGKGLMVYLICLFLMLYAAAGIRKLYYISAIIGLLDAIVLIFFWKYPPIDKARLYNWDFYIAFKFDMLLLATFIICLIISLIATLIKAKANKA